MFLEKMESQLTHAIESAATSVGYTSASTTSESITGHIFSTFYKLYGYIILSPLARLYLHGPSWGTFGFWNGIDVAVICSQKTQLSPSFWEEHPRECLQLVSKQFFGTVVLFETIIYFIVIWSFLKSLMKICYNFKFIQSSEKTKTDN